MYMTEKMERGRGMNADELQDLTNLLMPPLVIK